MQLTQKEASLLKDLKSQEKLCIDKYNKHADAAIDPQLQSLFQKIASVEQQHYDTISSMEQGTVPPSGGGQQQTMTFTAAYGMADAPDKQNDCYLCSDVLATEKHASGLYNTCIFEFKDTAARDALNHIQKEEQQHGKEIYDYMSVNNMYS